MASRLEIFRSCIARLDPAANPRVALREDLYVDPPSRSLAQRIAAVARIAPTSSQLVVGCVGSGKSTEILLATKHLVEAEDTLAFYIDISRHHDLSKIKKGVLFALVGLNLSRRLKDEESPGVVAARKSFDEWAHGYIMYVPYGQDSDYGYPDDEPPDGGFERPHRIPGLLSPPIPPLGWETKKHLDDLKTLIGALPPPKSHVVVLFDSLDRVADAAQLRALALEDLRALRSVGVGAVVVGPNRLVYGVNRPIVDLFDHLHTQPALDVECDGKAAAFLGDIIARRTDDEILPGETRAELVRWSGGILRDLISLARLALEEAFLADSDAVKEDHVKQAADRFGRSLMIGLRSEELAKLQRLRVKGTFVPTSDDDLALLESRRVVELGGITTRYAVHPTIAPLLAELVKP